MMAAVAEACPSTSTLQVRFASNRKDMFAANCQFLDKSSNLQVYLGGVRKACVGVSSLPLQTHAEQPVLRPGTSSVRGAQQEESAPTCVQSAPRPEVPLVGLDVLFPGVLNGIADAKVPGPNIRPQPSGSSKSSSKRDVYPDFEQPGTGTNVELQNAEQREVARKQGSMQPRWPLGTVSGTVKGRGHGTVSGSVSWTVSRTMRIQWSRSSYLQPFIDQICRFSF